MDIGEAAGHLAAFGPARGTVPPAVRATPALLADFERQPADAGVELAWRCARVSGAVEQPARCALADAGVELAWSAPGRSF